MCKLKKTEGKYERVLGGGGVCVCVCVCGCFLAEPAKQ